MQKIIRRPVAAAVKLAAIAFVMQTVVATTPGLV